MGLLLPQSTSNCGHPPNSPSLNQTFIPLMEAETGNQNFWVTASKHQNLAVEGVAKGKVDVMLA